MKLNQNEEYNNNNTSNSTSFKNNYIKDETNIELFNIRSTVATDSQLNSLNSLNSTEIIEIDSLLESASKENNKLLEILSTQNYILLKIKKSNFISNHYKTISFITKHLFFLILFYISTYYYLISLKGCPENSTMMWCLGHFGHWEVRVLIWYLNISSFTFSLIVYILINTSLYDKSKNNFTFEKIRNKALVYLARNYNPKKVIFGILLATFCYLLLYHDTGMDLYHHGGYNRIIFLISTPIFYYLISLFIYVLIQLHKDFKNTLMFLIIIFTVLFGFYKYLITGSCDYWKYGFKGTQLDNSDLSCVVPIPEICSFTIFDNLLDIPKLSGANCSDHSQYLYLSETVIPFSNLKYSNTEYFGYPRTEKWDMVKNTSYGIFQKHVLNNLVDMEDPNNNEIVEDIEFTLDFRNSTMSDKFKANLTLKKNYTLEEEMIKKHNEFISNNTKPLFNNVLVIFIDSLSRNHFRRKLPLTFDYLEQKYNNTEYNKKDISSYQFFKFSSLYPGTLANMAVMYYGNYPHNPSTSVLRYYKDAGYVLGSSMNYCGRETIDVEGEIQFYEQQHDHELAGLFCDPNLHSLQGPYSFFNGPYSMTKKCLWGKESVDWSIDYAKQFFSAYKNNSKFFRLSIIDSHEASGEMIKYDDEKILDLLEWYEKEGFMDDSLVMVMADHGFFMPGWIYEYFNFEDYHIEMTLPAYYMLIPNSNPYFKYMNYFSRMNEQNLLTTFDLHKCLEGIVHPSNEGWGICPFLGVQNTTSCDFFSIDSEWCRCFDKTKSD